MTTLKELQKALKMVGKAAAECPFQITDRHVLDSYQREYGIFKYLQSGYWDTKRKIREMK